MIKQRHVPPECPRNLETADRRGRPRAEHTCCTPAHEALTRWECLEEAIRVQGGCGRGLVIAEGEGHLLPHQSPLLGSRSTNGINHPARSVSSQQLELTNNAFPILQQNNYYSVSLCIICSHTVIVNFTCQLEPEGCQVAGKTWFLGASMRASAECTSLTLCRSSSWSDRLLLPSDGWAPGALALCPEPVPAVKLHVCHTRPVGSGSPG